ncbi:MAG: glutaminyl-tRNA synthase (glutamine-hydrolyzing) subunit B [Bdellovibrionales bacterium GWB1_55_8]|nr:MAG: glutaminyl-tRNA synthase (glutamine-hydrolyzing) subunit B [Bdellovibrionales bacterium GWB1_55_8]
MNFEAVIGLEVHAQLATDSKIFCGCPARPPAGRSVAEIPPNANTCPICTGHPGTLPVLNEKVVDYAILAGIATRCSIRGKSVFARKNYFYPDLPKGYQISQYDEPICEKGWLEIQALPTSPDKRIGINRIHMEEDAGKNVHAHGYSLVNLNRAGVPLIEIVSEPELSSAAEAGAYLRSLHAVVTYLGISDGNMQEGNFRCDANVSVRPAGQKEFGTRVEIKNVNSFRFVEKAIDYEIQRQIGVIEGGGKIVQETRTFDSNKNVTISMRSKEEAEDYRYFPDPDLIPVRVTEARVNRLRSELPELPDAVKRRFMTELGLSAEDAAALTSTRDLALFFEEALQALSETGIDRAKGAKALANWLTGEVGRLLNESGVEIRNSRLTVVHLADLVRVTLEGAVSSTGAKQALSEAWSTGESIPAVVARLGLKQVSDLGELEPAVEKVIAAFPGQAAEFRAGKEKLLGFFVGQVMKATGGKANPALLQELVAKKLKQMGDS